MIVVELSGGLGNQMSNYAFAKLIKYKFPETDVYLYTGNYNAIEEHNGYELENDFCRLDNSITQISNSEYYRVSGRIPYFSRVFRNRPVRLVLNAVNMLSAKIKDKTGIDPLIIEKFGTESIWVPNGISQLDTNRDYVFRGLWLNYHYPEVINDLKQDFSFRVKNDVVNQKFAEIITSSNAVALHIRRGDFLSDQYNDEHNIVTQDYYRFAIQVIKERVTDPTFFVFSDDLQFAEDYAASHMDKYVVVNGNTGLNSYMDMYLMSLCDHYVLTNSSFGYWGCLIGRKETSIVVSPAKHSKTIRMWKVPGFIYEGQR